MTEKQEQRIRDNIKKIRSTLAAEKRFHKGYFDDSRGLRYVSPGLYLKIKDYKGAARYFNWFDKNFSRDMGYGTFWFEYAISSFKNKKIKMAERKILESFMSNDYLIDQFLGHPLKDRINNFYSDYNRETATEHFPYLKEDPEFAEFSDWLRGFIETPVFLNISKEFINIAIKLKTETVETKRSALVDRTRHLLDDY